jgi:hypothetical protein
LLDRGGGRRPDFGAEYVQRDVRLRQHVTGRVHWRLLQSLMRALSGEPDPGRLMHPSDDIWPGCQSVPVSTASEQYAL